MQAQTEEDRDEQTTVDDQRAPKKLPDLASLLPPDPIAPMAAGVASRKPIFSEAPSPQSSNVLPARSRLNEPLVASGGKTGGSAMDELIQDEGPPPPPSLELLRSPAGPALSSGMPSVDDAAVVPAWLVVQSGSDRGRRFLLKGERTSVGRAIDNDLVLTDIAVSRKHLNIEFDGSKYIMSDLGSGNGTLVNDRDEDGGVQLYHGDELKLGKTVLVFECTASSAQPRPRSTWPARSDDDLGIEKGYNPGKPARVAEQSDASNRAAVGSTTQRGAPSVRIVPRPAISRPSEASQVVRPRRPSSHESPAPFAATSEPSNVFGIPAVAPDGTVPAPGRGRPAFPSSAPPHEPAISDEIPIGTRSTLPVRGRFAFPPELAGSAIGQPGTSPRFQYPDGVMLPLPAYERRRVLIAILGIAFVAVGAGIVMALVHRGGEQVASTAGDQPSAAETPARTPEPSATTAAAERAPEASTIPAPDRPDPGATGKDLYGGRELGPVDFGTEEHFLAGMTSGSSAPAATSDAVAPPVREDPNSKATTGKDEADRPSARERRERRRELRRRARASRRASSDEAGDAAGDGTRSSRAVAASSAVRQAEFLYKQKQFDTAAALLRRASRSAGRRDGRRMRNLANNYARIGSLLAEGRALMVSDAPRSLEAFKTALRMDEAFGDSEHDGTIGARIAEVAPAAAAAYMARKEYPEAKAAADLAEKFGSGDSDRVRGVRTSLERRATELYEEAVGRAQAGDVEGAAETARLILRMVSRSSDMYSHAAKLAGP